MIQTLSRNWFFLALGGLVQAVIAAIYLVMQRTDGPVTFLSWNGTVAFVGKLALVAGACAIAAGIWRSATGKSWLLVLNGLALIALGLIQYAFVRFPVSLLLVAVLIIVMAATMGILELMIARTLRREGQLAAGRLPAAAGVASFAFCLPFLALGFRWIRIEPGSHADLLWLAAWFAFSSICMLGMALGLYGRGLLPSGQTAPLPPFADPRPAH